MKILFLSLFICITSLLFAQPKIEFNAQKSNNGITLFATNQEYCPVSAKMKLNINNLVSDKGNEFIIVVPAKTSNYFLVDLKKDNPLNSYSYAYDVASTFGDVTLTNYDTNLAYNLPYQKNEEYKVQQGYFGKYTHQNDRALDFEMPIGTMVSAARSGIIITQIEHNTKHCANSSCLGYNNYIEILHSDGTIANYSHLKFKSCKFKLGDFVKAGDVIAESGETGYTSGPHLHFLVYLPSFDHKKTIATMFKINDGKEFSLLEEKQFYLRNY